MIGRRDGGGGDTPRGGVTIPLYTICPFQNNPGTQPFLHSFFWQSFFPSPLPFIDKRLLFPPPRILLHPRVSITCACIRDARNRPVTVKRGVSLVVQAKEQLDRTTGYIGKDNSGNGNIFAIEPRQLYTESPTSDKFAKKAGRWTSTPPRSPRLTPGSRLYSTVSDLFTTHQWLTGVADGGLKRRLWFQI